MVDNRADDQGLLIGVSLVKLPVSTGHLGWAKYREEVRSLHMTQSLLRLSLEAVSGGHNDGGVAVDDGTPTSIPLKLNAIFENENLKAS